MNLLFLCSSLARYFYDCINYLSKDNRVNEILIVRKKQDKNAPFVFKPVPQIQMLFLEDFNSSELIQKVTTFNPTIVYLPGWIDKKYIKIASNLHKKGSMVVMGIDNQWRNTLRQKIGALYFRIFLKRRIDYIWVPGSRQALYAKKLSFKRGKILSGLYTASEHFFNHEVELKRKEKIIIFLGRFVPAKGILDLVYSFNAISSEIKSEWKLLLIGKGSLREELEKYVSDQIEIKDFVQPENLLEIFNKAACFCLPSHFENWGVVAHEATAAGLPIIISSECGSSVAFLDNERNGFSFKAGDRRALKVALEQLMQLTDEEREKMGKNSKIIAAKITPNTWKYQLLSIKNPV